MKASKKCQLKPKTDTINSILVNSSILNLELNVLEIIITHKQNDNIGMMDLLVS